jgi:hypothetical protein
VSKQQPQQQRQTHVVRPRTSGVTAASAVRQPISSTPGTAIDTTMKGSAGM